MDQVDGIIIQTLESLGCELGENVISVSHLSAEMVVEAVGRCIKLIDPSIDVQCRMPSNMAAKFRVGTQLADALKSLNYQGQVGYHTFLYANEIEMRKVFSFLISRLPKDKSNIEQECLTPHILLRRAINKTILQLTKQIWLPSYCYEKDDRIERPFEAHTLLMPFQFDKQNNIPTEYQKYYSHHLPLLIQQSTTTTTNDLHMFSSIIEFNSMQLANERSVRDRYKPDNLTIKDSNSLTRQKTKDYILSKISSQIKESLKQAASSSSSSSSMFASSSLSSSKFLSKSKQKLLVSSSVVTQISDNDKKVEVHEQDVISEDTKIDIKQNVESKQLEEEAINDAEDELKKLVDEVDEVEGMMIKMRNNIQQMADQITQLTEANKRRKDEVKMKKKMIGLLPEAQESIIQLEKLISTVDQRLVNMTNQWEEKKGQLEVELNELATRLDNKESRKNQLMDELNDVRSNIKLVTSQAVERDALHKQLLTDHEKMNRGQSRSIYTTRILEIVANIMKQNQAIDKILMDTRSVQKEINQLSGVLDRTFIVTDELIFKTAKTDETSRRAYKLLASLHENCGSLVKSVEEIGEITKEMRDIEEQLEIESHNQTEESLDKITTDYKLIKQENQQLLQQLKAKIATTT